MEYSVCEIIIPGNIKKMWKCIPAKYIEMIYAEHFKDSCLVITWWMLNSKFMKRNDGQTYNRTSTTYRICHPCSLYKCPHFHLAVIPFEHQPKSFRYPYFSCCVYVLSDPTHPEHSLVRLPAMYIVSKLVLRTGLSLGISSLSLLLLFWKI